MSKLYSNLAIAIFTSSSANLIPMQFLGPAPNGWNIIGSTWFMSLILWATCRIFSFEVRHFTAPKSYEIRLFYLLAKITLPRADTSFDFERLGFLAQKFTLATRFCSHAHWIGEKNIKLQQVKTVTLRSYNQTRKWFWLRIGYFSHKINSPHMKRVYVHSEIKLRIILNEARD